MAKGDRLALNYKLYTVSEQQLQSMPARVEAEMQGALYRLAQQTRDMARSLCPVDTGALKASIYVTGASGGKSVVGGQSTTGYFRAINTAVKNRLTRQFKTPPTKAEISEEVSAGLKRESGMHKIVTSKIGDHTFRSYTKGGVSGASSFLAKGTEADQLSEFSLPSIMEMGHAGRGAFFVTIGAAVYYAGDVEFGHIIALGGKRFGHVEARPFMRPAMAWAKMQLNRVVTDAVKRGLAK